MDLNRYNDARKISSLYDIVRTSGSSLVFNMIASRDDTNYPKCDADSATVGLNFLDHWQPHPHK